MIGLKFLRRRILSWLGFADVIFGGDKQQPEIRLRSQANDKSIKLNKLPCWPRSSVGRASEDLIRRS